MPEKREWLILAGAEQDHSSLTITAVNVSIIGQFTLEADGVFIELDKPVYKADPLKVPDEEDLPGDG